MKIRNCLLCLSAIVICCTAAGCQDKKPAANSESETALTEQNTVTNSVQDSDSAQESNDLNIQEPNPTESKADPVMNNDGVQELGGDENAVTETVKEDNNSSDSSNEPDADANSRSEVNVQNQNVNVEGNLNENGEQELGDDMPETVNPDEEMINPTDEEGNEEL